MKYFIILICVFSSFTLFAQNQFYLKGGIGTSSLVNNRTSLNALGGNLDAELTYDFKKPITIGFNSITGYAFNLSDQNQTIFHQQENLNLYFRLFDNRVIVGGGMSAAHLWSRTETDFDVNNNSTNYLITNDLLLGVNFTVIYKIKSIGEYNLHLKAYRQACFPGNITGISLLIGN